MKKEKMIDRFIVFFAKEAGIELKAALYFWCILFFYAAFRILQGSWDASIIFLFEMIGVTYLMGYVQTFVFGSFDEGEAFTGQTIGYSALCSGIYTVVAWFFHWFENSIMAYGLFFLYILVAYLCAWWMYKVKQIGETRAMNEELKAFQKRGKE